MARVNPALGAIVAEGFLSRLAFGLVGFTLPLYAYSLGLSLAEIGVLAGLNSAVALLLKPVMGWVADRHGLKRSLTVAIALRSLLCLSYAGAVLPWQLFAVRAGHGVADSLRDPSVNALIAEHGGKKAVASSFAWYQTAKTFAGSIGKGVAGVALTVTAGRHGLVFGAAFALSALPLAVVARYVREPDRTAPLGPEPVSPAPAAGPPGATPAAATPAPGTLRFAVLGFLISGSASMLGTLFPILATEYAGLSPAQAGALYLVTPFLAFTGPLFGWLADHVDTRLVLSLRSAANTLSSLLYLVSPTFAGFFSGKALDDLGKAAFSPAWGSVMAHVSGFDRRNRARIMSVLSAGEDAGDILAPIVAGLLWSWWGAGAVLLTRLGVSVAAEGYALAVTGPLHRPAVPAGVRPSRHGGRHRGTPRARRLLPLRPPQARWSLASAADLEVYVVGDEVVTVPGRSGPGGHIHAGGPGSVDIDYVPGYRGARGRATPMASTSLW